jgi:hypothetical protein
MWLATADAEAPDPELADAIHHICFTDETHVHCILQLLKAKQILPRETSATGNWFVWHLALPIARVLVGSSKTQLILLRGFW